MLLLVDLGAGRNRLGGFVARAGVRRTRRDAAGSRRSRAADAVSPRRWRELRAQDLVLAYHDRSDGGLFATLVEMAFAGHCGLDVKLPAGADGAAARAVREELGVVLQVRGRTMPPPCSRCSCGTGSATLTHALGAPTRDDARAHRSGDRPRRRIAGRTCAAPGPRPRSACASCATNPAARARNSRAACDTGDPGPQRRADVRSATKTSPRRTSHTARPQGRGAARAGRQQPGRDGRGVRARRLRSARRAHERPARRAACSSRTSGAWSPAAASRMATCSARARAGRSPSCSRARARRVPALLRAPRHLRARRLQRLPDVRRAQGARCRAPRAGRGSCATAASNSKGASRWCELAPSPSVFLAGMDGSMLPIAVAHGEGRAEFANEAAAQRVLERRAGVARATSKAIAASRPAIRRIRTARRSASRRSATQTAA